MGILLFVVLAIGMAWLMCSAVKALRTSTTSSVLGTSLAQPSRLVAPVSAWARSVSRFEVDPDPDDGGWAYTWSSDPER
jgi:hypothetical protein